VTSVRTDGLIDRRARPAWRWWSRSIIAPSRRSASHLPQRRSCTSAEPRP